MDRSASGRERAGINLLACIPDRTSGHENFMIGTTCALVARGAYDYVAFVPKPFEAWWRSLLGHADVVVCGMDPRNRIRRVAFEQTRLPSLARQAGIDVMFCPHLLAPRWRQPRVVVSLLDLLLLSGLGNYSRLRRQYHRHTYRRLAARAAHIVTISEFCRQDIHARLGVPLERITRAYCGLDRAFVEAPPAAAAHAAGQGRYLLSVAAAYPHKALPTVIEAFEAVSSDHPDLQLLLAGTHAAPPPDVAVVRAAVAASPLRDRIQFEPPLASGDLVALFAGAAAYVSASRFEGFGIPVVEAMAVGCPVAASPAGAVVEVLSGFGFLASDFSAAALAQAIAQAIEARTKHGPRLEDAARHARTMFTWERAAEAVEGALAAAGPWGAATAPTRPAAVAAALPAGRAGAL